MEGVFRAFVEHAPMAMALFDDQMRYLLANRAWVVEFGLQNVTDLVGRSQYEVFPGLHPGWRQVYDRAMQQEKPVRTEHDAGAGADGRRVLYRWEVRSWKRKADGPVGGVSITCEKFYPDGLPQAQPAAQPDTEPVSPFAKALSGSSVPMVLLDDQGTILEANRGAVDACLARGLQEGRSLLWEAFGEGRDLAVYKQRAIEMIARLSATEAGSEVVLEAPERQDEEAEGSSGAPATPSRWLLAAAHSEDGEKRVLAVALPGGDLPAQKLTVQVAQAGSTAFGPKASALEGLNAIAVKQVEDQLGKARQEIANLRAAENAFVKREARQRAVMEALPCGILVLDERGQVAYQNEHLARLTGRPLTRGDTVEGWLAQGCPTEEHRERVCRIWREDVWRRQLKKVISLVTESGHLKDLLMQPSFLQGGGLVVTVTDTTEDCRSQESLRSTDAKFRALLQESPVGIVLVDKAGAVFEVNSAAENLLGRSKASLRQMSPDEWLTEASTEDRKAAVREMVESGRRVTSLDVTAIRNAGEHSQLNLRLAIVQDADGKPHCLVYFLREKAAPAPPPAPAAAPPASAVAAPAPEPVPAQTAEPEPETVEEPGEPQIVQRRLLATDANGRIADWSPEGESLFGYSASEAVGHWLHTLFRPSDATGFYTELLMHISAPPSPFTWSYFGNEGKRGSGTFVVRSGTEGGLSAELSEQVEIPGVPRAARKAPALEPIRGPHTHVVRPSQLWPVADLDREKLILSETHHRIKNHLQIISSMLNLQMNTLGDSAAKSALRSSQNRVRSIAALHQHLYQLALGETRDFAGFAQELIRRLREAYEVSEDRVALRLDLDAAAIQQEWLMPLALILNETISNAFEHAFPGDRAGQVIVKLSLTGETGEFSVTDDGVGLPEGFNPSIVPGLGLKILGVFAEQMRGELTLTGVPGQGAQFNLRFPIASADN